MHSLPCKEITKVILPYFILSDAILFESLLFYICRSLKIGPEFGLRLVLSSPINIRQPIYLPLLLFYKLLLVEVVWETFTNILAPFLLFKILKLITVVWLSLGQTPSYLFTHFELKSLSKPFILSFLVHTSLTKTEKTSKIELSDFAFFVIYQHSIISSRKHTYPNFKPRNLLHFFSSECLAKLKKLNCFEPSAS